MLSRLDASPSGPMASHLRNALVGGVVAAAMLLGLLPGTVAAAPVAWPTANRSQAMDAPSASTIKLTKVVDGLSKPVFITSARDGTGRMFIVEKTGTIRVLVRGSVLPTPLIDLSATVSTGAEQGLLGLAFHPGFRTNRRFYVDFTNASGNTVIREYKVSKTNPNRVEKGSGRTILKLGQPYANHNGGMIAFGPDGYLYIGTGDGGSGGDPGNRAQRKTTLLGKILRINVNGTTARHSYRIPRSNPYVGRKGRDEIWQRGVRNPWRFSFDRLTHDLFIADVGQSAREEVDFQPAGSGGGQNYGWKIMEGTSCYSTSACAAGVPACNDPILILPILEYGHVDGNCSIIGGYVYRGSLTPSLYGAYVYGDYCSGRLWAARQTGGMWSSQVLAPSAAGLTCFGEDANSELYLATQSGALYRVH